MRSSCVRVLTDGRFSWRTLHRADETCNITSVTFSPGDVDPWRRKRRDAAQDRGAYVRLLVEHRDLRPHAARPLPGWSWFPPPRSEMAPVAAQLHALDARARRAELAAQFAAALDHRATLAARRTEFTPTAAVRPADAPQPVSRRHVTIAPATAPPARSAWTLAGATLT